MRYLLSDLEWRTICVISGLGGGLGSFLQRKPTPRYNLQLGPLSEENCNVKFVPMVTKLDRNINMTNKFQIYDGRLTFVWATIWNDCVIAKFWEMYVGQMQMSHSFQFPHHLINVLLQSYTSTINIKSIKRMSKISSALREHWNTIEERGNSFVSNSCQLFFQSHRC